MRYGWTAVLIACAAVCQAQSGMISYQGQLTVAGGSAVEGQYGMRFTLFDAAAAGTQLWRETETSVTVRNGLFFVILGDGEALGALFGTHADLWLEVAADLSGDGMFTNNEIYVPRQRLAGLPWAHDAARLQGLAAADLQRRVTGAAPPGRFITGINADGSVVTAADQLGLGTLSGILPGPGLTGGGTSGAVTLAVQFGASGTSTSVARADHKHLGSDILSAVANASTAVVALSARGLHGRPVSNPVLLKVGQTLRWNGTEWEPTSPADQPPVALLDAKPAAVYASRTSEPVQLSLIDSYDPEGGALTYAFDPTGLATSIPSAWSDVPSTTVQVVGGLGSLLAAGWVRDPVGNVARAQAMIYVYHWSTVSPDGPGDVGAFASLAEVGGQPAIAYYSETNGNLSYVRAVNVQRGYWANPVYADDDAAVVGTYASLAVVNGRPAIAYFDQTNVDLKYVRASDATGAAWGAPVAVDSPGLVGQYASLAVVNGRPAIAYYDSTPHDLKYVRASDANGAAWGAPVTVAGVGDVGLYASLRIVGGRPAIAYYDQTNTDLKYVRASDANGTAWGAPVSVDAAGDVGQYASLAVVNGRPAIAYHDNTNHDLKYVRADDSEGAYPSLVIVNGRPAVAYYDATNGDLKYMRASDADGAAWAAPVIVDNSGDVGPFASTAIADGRPCVAYYDLTNGDLKFVRASNADGTAWGTPVIVDSGGDVGWFVSLAVPAGPTAEPPAIAYVDVTNSELKFARAANREGTLWWPPVRLDAPGLADPCLAFFSGFPAIALYSDWGLRFIMPRPN